MSTKNDVLAILEESRNLPVSGNDIANKLGLSRASVWKAVNSLKQDGYSISSVNKVGYTLLPNNDILSREGILPYVNDLNFFSNLQVFNTIQSTNDEAKLQAITNKANGICIISEEQTAGKGRLGRSFYSPAKSGIYMSVILRLGYDIEQNLLITSAVSVAVCRAISKICNIECNIKWVNDIYIKNKKVCGILTEATFDFESKSLDYIIVGIGINVHSTAYPEELQDIVTALSEHTSEPILRCNLIAQILNELQIVVNDLTDKTFLTDYKNKSCVIGEKINVITPNQTYLATAIDINDNGNLIVKNDSNEEIILNSGEISIRKC